MSAKRGESIVEEARYNGVAVTFSDREYACLMAWIEKQDPKPSKSAAVRGMVLAALGIKGR